MDPNEFLMAGGLKAIAFPDGQYGTTGGGTIVREPETRQQTDFDTGKPKFYDDGKPMWQLLVAVQTTEKDPTNPHDDGIRGFYIKGQMRDAVKAAILAAGATGINQGGELFITYVADKPNATGRGKPAKQYTARYTPPPATGGNDWLTAGGGTPAASETPPDGISPTLWAGLSPTQREALTATQQTTLPPF